MSTPHILSGADFALNSYMGHEFEVRELPSSKSGVCTQRSEDQTCGNGLFAVSENNDQLLTVNQGFEVEFLYNYPYNLKMENKKQNGKQNKIIIIQIKITNSPNCEPRF